MKSWTTIGTILMSAILAVAAAPPAAADEELPVPTDVFGAETIEDVLGQSDNQGCFWYCAACHYSANRHCGKGNVDTFECGEPSSASSTEQFLLGCNCKYTCKESSAADFSLI